LKNDSGSDSESRRRCRCRAGSGRSVETARRIAGAKALLLKLVVKDNIINSNYTL
jgi:hypothetical protein